MWEGGVGFKGEGESMKEKAKYEREGKGRLIVKSGWNQRGKGE